MDIPAELKDRLTASEGLKKVPYTDSRGFLTVAIGHKLSTPLTVGACDYILMDDIAAAAAELDKALPWASRLDEVRFFTLVELTFNMGIGVPGGQHGLLSFAHTLRAIEIGDYATAAEMLLQSTWATQVGLDRSSRIAAQIRDGVWS